MREIKYIFIHHTLSSRDKTTIDDLYKWHVIEQGWKAIGYNSFIDGKGVVHECRPDKMIGSHVKNLNT